MGTRERLHELWAEIQDLASTEELLSWDQETFMPRAGHVVRGQLLSTLAGIKHQRLTSPELSEALEQYAQERQDPILVAELCEARRHVARARRVPRQLAQALAAARSRALEGWQRARAEDDFTPLRPALEQLIELKRQEAQACADGGPLYDSLLQEYEPELNSAQLDALFAELEAGLTRLLDAVRGSGRTVSDAPVRGSFDPEQQFRFCRWLAERLGFDPARGRIDRSAHPFCVGLARDDVRFTWRCDPEDLRPAILGTLHEAGHALYEQGLPAEWQRAPLGVAASLGIHESQSRLWENHVGRSRGFWRGVLPRLVETFPGWAAGTVEELWPALHAVEPSLVRTEADQTTYALHIVARYRLERQLIEGSLAVADLPAAWQACYRELLGIEPVTANQGVLQDIHWPMGLFGYFPTYAIGSLASAQLFEAALAELGNLELAFAELDFVPLLVWLRERIHGCGARYPAPELLERATGKPLAAGAFLRHVASHAESVYGVEPKVASR